MNFIPGGYPSADCPLQSSVDFEFTALVMKEGFDQLARRMRLQESQLSAVLQAADKSIEVYQPTTEQISDLESQVSALERARDSAA